MPNKNQSVLMGGLVVALLSTSYLGYINVICCLGVMIGAVVAVWHYTDTNEATLTGGQGAVLGLQAALIGGIVSWVLNFALLMMGIRHDLAFSQMMVGMYENSMPEVADQMQAEIDKPYTFVKHLWGLLGIPVMMGFGAIGGLIGAKMFKKGGEEPSIGTVAEV